MEARASCGAMYANAEDTRRDLIHISTETCQAN
jgi:hypothetical protein